MFEFLRDITTEQATASVYYAIRIIKHIKQVKDTQEGYRVEGLDTEPSKDDAINAWRIISEIEEAERTPLAELSKAKAERYIQQLADILQELVRQRLKYDAERGKVL
jgi:hypothetical protein